MEFYEKLQELRKKKGLTQEQLAEALFVSRTAISKWESGRGYPNIESLKAIAKLFSVSIDDLLSGDELLTVAEEDNKQQQIKYVDLLFGLLDLCAVVLFILPLFREGTYGVVLHVPLISLLLISSYLKVIYMVCVAGMVGWGILTFVLQNCDRGLWLHTKYKISLLINGFGVILFILGRQPYPAILLLVFLAIKTILIAKKQ